MYGDSTEQIILKKWLNEKQKICFWGASEGAIYKEIRLISERPDCFPTCIIDNQKHEDLYLGRENRIEIRKPEEINLSEYKILLFISNKTAFHEVSLFLNENGLDSQEDFIDATKLCLVDRNGLIYEDYQKRNIYAPWAKDDAFWNVMSAVGRNTLVDYYKCHELWRLVLQSQKCSDGDFLEVGVWKGGTGALIAKAAEVSCPDAKVYLVDTFEGVVKAGEKDAIYYGGEHADTSMKVVSDLIASMNLHNTTIMQGIFPDDMEDMFRQIKYRFVHIDVDVYDSARDIFEHVWVNVIRGGYVIFDDFGCAATSGVTELGNELEASVNDGLFIYNLNEHGIMVKI